MAQKQLTLKDEYREISFSDLDSDKEIEITITDGLIEDYVLYLSSEDLFALKEHIDYLVRKIE